MLTSDRIILHETDFFSRILSVLGGVIRTVTGEFTHESDEFALGILFSHKDSLIDVNFQRLIVANYSSNIK